MTEHLDDLGFGELILLLRKKSDWTVKEFIKKLEEKGQETVSPAYITRIEQYGEIPSPELICRIADVFHYDVEKLLNCAKRSKVEKFDKSLEEKYQKAVGLYRTQKEKK
jgi:transcriptional regulator with XRE-family HTH domain